MNYLISAYSVNPYKGSEDSIGWNWVLQHEKNWKPGDLIVLLTKKYNEEDTKRGLKEFGIKHIELVIVDVPLWLNWFREKHSMFHHMYYILWQHWAWMWVKHSGIRFDVIHHVTMNDYRITSEMYKLKTAKVIWGPVGGAQVTPEALKVYEKNRTAALFREWVNRSCSWNPFYRKAVRSYYKIYCINEETRGQLEQIIGRKLELLPELALADQFKNIAVKKRQNEVPQIVFVGRLIGKKGISFLIDALRMIPADIQWELKIFGDGDDRDLVTEKIKQSGLSDKIKMMGSRPMNQIAEAYQNVDVFVLPSLRETSGNVLLEAMAYAIPIVSFNTSFCSELAKHQCGIFINTNQPLEAIQKDYANAIVTLIQDKTLGEQLGQNGYGYVNSELSWDEKFQTIYKSLE